MSFDPTAFPLEADLSRADVRLLYRLCDGKSVVEFGCGGSTVMLAHFCASLRSYDTDPSWIERTQRRLAREDSALNARVMLFGCNSVPADLPAADVYFVDGYVPDRKLWIEAIIDRRLAEVIIVHDSRSSAMTDIGQVISWPRSLSLRSLEYHVGGSNMLLIRCGAPCEYVNWNEAEPENRLPFLG